MKPHKSCHTIQSDVYTMFMYTVSTGNTGFLFLVIPENKVGVVRAITGLPIPPGNVMAKSVDCDLSRMR